MNHKLSYFNPSAIENFSLPWIFINYARSSPRCPRPPSPRQNNQSIKLPHVTFLSPSYRGGSVMSYSHHLSIINQFVKPCNFADYVRNLSGIYQNMIIFEEDWFFSKSFRIRNIYTLVKSKSSLNLTLPEIATQPHNIQIAMITIMYMKYQIGNCISIFVFYRQEKRHLNAFLLQHQLV